MSKSQFPTSVDECVRVIEEAKAQVGMAYVHSSNFAITKPEIETLYGEGFILYLWGVNQVGFIKKEHIRKRRIHMFLRRHAYTDYRETTPILYQLGFEGVGRDINRQKLYDALKEKNVAFRPGGEAWGQSTYSLTLEEAIQLYNDLDKQMPAMMIKSKRQQKPQPTN